MKLTQFITGLLLIGSISGTILIPQLLNAEETRVPMTVNESEIRECAKAFSNAFNSGDAKAIAAQWTMDGDYTNEAGIEFNGREAIEKEYTNFFKQYPGVKIKIDIEEIKMLSETSAIEEGTATLGEFAPVECHYVLIHVKKNGKWLIASARDMRIEAKSNFERFSELEKLIGTWSHETSAGKIETTYRWIANKKFIERKFSVSIDGKTTLSGTQIIGWEPSSQQITSWLFDSTGGNGVATWTPTEKGWMIQSSGVTSDGTTTAATNYWNFSNNDTITWNSTNRLMGNEPLAEAAELTLKRNK
ncbi:SgcJ/EcaC family oxidoreductase [Mariniblastus sp.]|nr:SgcJ/EcaC family oxidoreductase [Mariniblastus sp.]